MWPLLLGHTTNYLNNWVQTFIWVICSVLGLAVMLLWWKSSMIFFLVWKGIHHYFHVFLHLKLAIGIQYVFAPWRVNRVLYGVYITNKENEVWVVVYSLVLVLWLTYFVASLFETIYISCVFWTPEWLEVLHFLVDS